ncbi:MAG: hypothetical protein JRF40_05270 [Deltaproteobacteria bacterium]|nr:hypothetical protein [Deltaproteobacteria bacterium]
MCKITITNLLISLVLVFCVTSISACKTTLSLDGINFAWGAGPEVIHAIDSKKVGKGGPPPHAPAHGYRAKHAYRYFPDSHVYFDVHREVYFYLSGDQWKMCVALPKNIRLHVCDYVSIEMDSDKPYTQFTKHKKKFPPGQLKKKKDKWARN